MKRKAWEIIASFNCIQRSGAISENHTVGLLELVRALQRDVEQSVCSGASSSRCHHHPKCSWIFSYLPYSCFLLWKKCCQVHSQYMYLQRNQPFCFFLFSDHCNFMTLNIGLSIREPYQPQVCAI